MDAISAIGDGLVTGVALMWKAAWALAFGYAISAAIQVFVFPREAERLLDGDGVRETGTALGLGFLSSSCSFAALSATRSLFAKGASLRSSLAFMFASTNLVIELAFLLWIFLGWQFVLALYVGTFLLVAAMRWLVLLLPRAWVDDARERAARDLDDGEDREQLPDDWRDRLADQGAWERVGMRYFMEWGMVWKELLVGFAVAGLVATLVPSSFFEALFPRDLPGWIEAPLHALIAPLLAILTVIGSMGNGPLAAILWNEGVAFAGIMAFLYADFVVPPSVKINAGYYGWRFALALAGVFTAAAVIAGVGVQALFELVGLIPDEAKPIDEVATFALDYTFVLNVLAAAATITFWWLRRRQAPSSSPSM